MALITTKPQVSVLMSVHNCENFLKEAVQSILDQTYKDFEFIIIDDCSDDTSWEILMDFADDRIVLHRNKTNLGLTKSLNLGLSKAKGHYVARMDADDISLPNRLEIQIEFITKNPKHVLIGSSADLIDAHDQRIGAINRYFSNDEVLGHIFFFNPIIHPSVLFDKNFILSIGGYDESFKKAQDYDLWFKSLSHGGKCHVLSDRLIEHREHKDSIESKFRGEQDQNAIQIVVLWLNKLLNLKTDFERVQNFRKVFRLKRVRSVRELITWFIFMSGLILKFSLHFPTRPRALMSLYVLSFITSAKVLLNSLRDFIKSGYAVS